MSLVHKDDIFNYEFAPQFIETELLCGEQQRLSIAGTSGASIAGRSGAFTGRQTLPLYKESEVSVRAYATTHERAHASTPAPSHTRAHARTDLVARCAHGQTHARAHARARA